MILENRLEKISYDKINENFSYGNYGGIKVILMNDNGYLNATKLCTLAKKHLYHWVATVNAKELISEVEKEINFFNDVHRSTLESNVEREPHEITLGSQGIKKEVIIVDSSFGECRGTYVHPLLVPHIASWCCPKFAIYVSKIANHFIIREYQTVIHQKDDKIDDLQRTLNEMKAQNDELLEESKHARKMLQTTSDKIDSMNEELIEAHGDIVDLKLEASETNEKLDTVQEKLGVAVVDRVPKLEAPSKREMFVVLKMGHKDKTKYQYYALRGQKAYINCKSRQLKKTYKHCTELCNIEYQPNSRNLFLRLKKYLKNRMTFSFNWFSIKDSLSERELLETISTVNDDKFHVEV